MREIHPDFITKFDLQFDYVQNATGNDNWQFDYVVYRNIVGIQRFNAIGKTVEERVTMEKSDSYKKKLAVVHNY